MANFWRTFRGRLPSARVLGHLIGAPSAIFLSTPVLTLSDNPHFEGGAEGLFPRLKTAAYLGVRLCRSGFIRDNPRQFSDVYELGEELGRGASGSVHIARHRLSGCERAVKRIPKYSMSAAEKRAFEMEVESLLLLDSPHVVRLIEYFSVGNYYHLVFEYCRGPDLFDYIVGKGQDGGDAHLPPDEISVLLRHMLKAVICCHSNGIIHRDIKPENFMFRTQNVSKSSLKMIDLGLCGRPSSTKFEMTGTPAYISPEMAAGSIYSFEADVWSLGVIFFSMATGAALFRQDTAGDYEATMELLKDVQDEEYLMQRINDFQDQLDELPPEGFDLLLQMLKHDPEERITPQEAVKHPFIKNARMEKRPAVDPRFRQIFDKDFGARMLEFANLPMLHRTALVAVAHLISDDAISEIRHTFRQMDEDGDGVLSLCDIKRALNMKGVTFPEGFDSVLRKIDFDKSGTINYLEFVASTLPRHVISSGLVASAFDHLDLDGDGYVSAADLRKLMGESDLPPVMAEAILREAVPKRMNKKGIDLEEMKTLLMGFNA